MNLIPWRNKRKENRIQSVTPRREIDAFRSEMDRFFERFFHDPWGTWDDLYSPLSAWTPAFDVTETDKHVTIRAEIPGVAPDDMDVTISENILTITGEKKETTEDRSGTTYRCERRFGKFQRSIELPSSVDTGKVSAEHKNGVLTIQLQRRTDAALRRIEVTAKR